MKNVWGVKPIVEKITPKKYTQEEKRKLARLQHEYGMSMDEIKIVSKKMMKKVFAHGDSAESAIELVRKHPEYHNLSWKEKKKMLKKRFYYLTNEEINYIGKISGDFGEGDL